MDRIRSWINRPEQSQQSLRQILSDKEITVQVYRRDNEAVADDGFSQEVSEATYLKNINVRVDSPRFRSDQGSMYCLADDDDVRIDDRWVYSKDRDTKVRMRVVSREIIEGGFSKVVIVYG